MSITFTIRNHWAILHQVSITTQKNESTSLVSISGSFRNVAQVLFHGRVLFGDSYDLGSIIIDGKRNIQGDEQSINSIFERVKRCIDQETGSATLDKMKKKLVIETGQGAVLKPKA